MWGPSEHSLPHPGGRPCPEFPPIRSQAPAQAMGLGQKKSGPMTGHGTGIYGEGSPAFHGALNSRRMG